VIGTTTASRITNAVLAEKIALSLKDWFTILEASVGEEVA
jgi:predicted oxidoreductase